MALTAFVARDFSPFHDVSGDRGLVQPPWSPHVSYVGRIPAVPPWQKEVANGSADLAYDDWRHKKREAMRQWR